MARRSFFDRLTGANDFDDDFEEEEATASQSVKTAKPGTPAAQSTVQPPQDEADAQLTVDVYQTDNEIIIKALVAGVRPEDLDVSITRDMVTVSGKRIDQKEVQDNNYFYRELYWGGFSRTVLLPQEIDVDAAEASEKYGLLVLRLPKINKDRQTKVKVKGN
jgi:HSP20 family molecular chaperone IbpA